MTTTTDADRGGVRAVLAPLRHRDFALLASGQSTSNIGDALYEVALPLLVLSIGGATELGFVLGCYGVARVAGLAASGPVVTRYGARPVMAVVDVIRAVLLGTLGGLTLSHGLTVPLLIIFAVPYGLCMGLFRPAYSSLLPRLVGEAELPASNAVLTTSTQCATFLGAALAGVLAGTGQVGPALLVDAATFIISVATLLAMRVRTEPLPFAGGGRQLRNAFSREAIAALRGRSAIAQLLLVIGVVNLLWGGLLEVSLPALMTRDFRSGELGYGLVIAAAGAGALIGALVIGSQRAHRHTGVLAFSSGVLQGVLLAVLPWSHLVIVAVVLMFAVGALNSVTNVIMVSFLQALAPSERLPYIMSLMWLLSFGLYPVSVLVNGFLTRATSPSLAMAIGGSVLVLGFVLGLSQPRLRGALTTMKEAA